MSRVAVQHSLASLSTSAVPTQEQKACRARLADGMPSPKRSPPQGGGSKAMKDMAALNADPTAKGREDHKAEMARMARATIELQLELNDATPERRRLFGRTEEEGACMCDSCTKRRLWIAIRRVGKTPAELETLDALDDLVTKAYQGDKRAVLEGLKTYGAQAVLHLGGPVAIAGCAECKNAAQSVPCYHCGRAEWMRSRKEMLVARKDLKSIPTYLIMPILHAACWGGHLLLVQKLLDMGFPHGVADDMGCYPLHWVTCQGHKSLKAQLKYTGIAELLLKAKADVCALDANMKLPMELTVAPNPPFPAMRMVILKHAQADLNTALLQHCRTGDVAMARRTIAAGADIGCGDWLNDTPMHVAITYGHKELVDLLVDVGMTQKRLRELVYSKTVDGLDCFDTAKKWGFGGTAVILQAYVEQARIVEQADKLVQGGGKLPMHLRGTLMGQRIEEEVKRQNKAQAKITKALRLQQKREKQRELRAARQALGRRGSSSQSQACVIM